MLTLFDQMPETSRLWIYQADRKLNQEEVSLIERLTTDFIDRWTAHGQDLKASFKIEREQFLVITLDEKFTGASGCSIDASVHHIAQLEKRLGISFMNNNKVAFLFDDNVELVPFNSIRERTSNNEINASTMVFDNTVTNLKAFNENWLRESGNTWLKRYF